MYCSKCGAAMADGAAFCSNCGQEFAVAAAVPLAPMMSASIADPIGIAFALILIPLIFLTGLGGFIGTIHPNEDKNDVDIFMLVGLLFLAATASLVFTWLYHALMESSEWQATVGKKLLGLVVTDMAGRRVSFWRATGRHFAKIITNMVPAFIGYIMAAFTEKRQALHDMIAGCLVLRRNS